MRIWCADYRNSTYTDAAMRDVTRFRAMKYFDGATLAGQFPSDASVEVRTKRPPTDFFRAGVFWIVSAKLRQILESHRVEAEYFSVQLVDRRGKPRDGAWWCFNPTLVLDWFDWSRSQYVAEKNFATEIKTITARPEVLDGVPLAVAERTIPDLVAVSDELAAAIAESGCTGVVFREPSEWRNPVDPVNS